MIFIDHLDEMSDNQGYGLDSLELLLGSELLSLEFDLIILDVVFLDVKELQISVEFLKLFVEVLLLTFS